MTAALGLAEQGYEVHLVEKESELGGNLRHLYTTLDGKDVQAFLEELRGRVSRHPRIHIHTQALITDFPAMWATSRRPSWSGREC